MISKINLAFSRFCDHTDGGKLLLRLFVGILLLFHGLAKVQPGVAWMADLLQSHGLPAFIRYGVYIGEIIAPILVILGIFTRIGGAIIAFNMIVAVLMVDLPHFWTLDSHGGWGLQDQAFFFFGGITIMLLGSGRYSLSPNANYR